MNIQEMLSNRWSLESLEIVLASFMVKVVCDEQELTKYVMTDLLKLPKTYPPNMGEVTREVRYELIDTNI